MGLLDRILGKRQTSPDKFNQSQIRPSELRRTGRWASADINVRRRMEMGVGYVAIAAKINADMCAMTPLRLYKRAKSPSKGTRRIGRKQRELIEDPRQVGRKAAYNASMGEVVEVTDHLALDVYKDPTLIGQGYAHHQLDQYLAEICGNSYSSIHWEHGRPWLSLMLPQFTEAVPDENGLLSYYYGRDTTQVQEFTPDEVAHFQLMRSAYNPWVGDSWTMFVHAEHEMHLSSNEHEVSRWYNESRPDLVIGVHENTTDTALAQMQADWDAKHRGARNPGRVVFAKASNVVYENTKPREMDYGAGREHVKKVIANASGVPVSMLDMTDASLGSAVAGNSQYRMMTIQPRMCSRAEWWTDRILAGELNIDPTEMWFAPEAVDTDDEGQRATIHSTYVTAGIVKINEVREELGKEPAEGGDVLRVNGQTFEEIAQAGQFAGFGGGILPPAHEQAVRTLSLTMPDDAEEAIDQRSDVPGPEADKVRDDDADAGVGAGAGGDRLGLPAGDDDADEAGPETGDKEPATVVDQKAIWLGEASYV